MDDAERHAAIQDAKFPEGQLDYDPECEDCDEGRVYNNADPSCGQYVLCECIERMKAKKPRTLEDIKKDLREVRAEIAGGATPKRQAELVDKLRVLRVEQIQVERSAEKGEGDGNG